MPKFRSSLPNRFIVNTDNPYTNGFIKSRNRFWQLIIEDKYSTAFVAGWIIPLIFIALYAYINLGKMPYEIPLFYSRVWGDDQLSGRNLIFLPIGGAFFLGIVNMFISFLLKNQDRLFTYLLLATSAILSVLATITVFNIINLVV